ncbi:DUF6128 domain-containing protein [Enterocloster lavalensis]|uniref:DUF6128 domain-containing protein n=1 Tax=Enterocloster lavalensis TaxID=460384 RepID=UPI0023F49746|nr:DUF6128 domain-containing protein [Enterocloster lavalensis]
MSNYRRLISYIYAYEGEVKGKNIGFVKLESRGGQCKLSVNVKKVYVGGSDLGVYLLAPGREISLGNIFIRSGAGEFRAVIPVENVADSGIGMDSCYGLSIHEPSDGWRCYTTIWEDAVAHAAEVELADVTSKSRRDISEEEEIHKKAEEIAAEMDREIAGSPEEGQPVEAQSGSGPSKEGNADKEGENSGASANTGGDEVDAGDENTPLGAAGTDIDAGEAEAAEPEPGAGETDAGTAGMAADSGAGEMNIEVNGETIEAEAGNTWGEGTNSETDEGDIGAEAADAWAEEADTGADGADIGAEAADIWAEGTDAGAGEADTESKGMDTGFRGAETSGLIMESELSYSEAVSENAEFPAGSEAEEKGSGEGVSDRSQDAGSEKNGRSTQDYAYSSGGVLISRNGTSTEVQMGANEPVQSGENHFMPVRESIIYGENSAARTEEEYGAGGKQAGAAAKIPDRMTSERPAVDTDNTENAVFQRTGGFPPLREPQFTRAGVLNPQQNQAEPYSANQRADMRRQPASPVPAMQWTQPAGRPPQPRFLSDAKCGVERGTGINQQLILPDMPPYSRARSAQSAGRPRSEWQAENPLQTGPAPEEMDFIRLESPTAARPLRPGQSTDQQEGMQPGAEPSPQMETAQPSAQQPDSQSAPQPPAQQPGGQFAPQPSAQQPGGQSAPQQATQQPGGRPMPQQFTQRPGRRPMPVQTARQPGGQPAASQTAQRPDRQPAPQQAMQPSSGQSAPQQAAQPSGGQSAPQQAAQPFGSQSAPQQAVQPSGGQSAPQQAVQPSGGQHAPQQAVQPSGGQSAPQQAPQPSGGQSAPQQAAQPARQFNSRQPWQQSGNRSAAQRSMQPSGQPATQRPMQSGGQPATQRPMQPGGQPATQRPMQPSGQPAAQTPQSGHQSTVRQRFMQSARQSAANPQPDRQPTAQPMAQPSDRRSDTSVSMQPQTDTGTYEEVIDTIPENSGTVQEPVITSGREELILGNPEELERLEEEERESVEPLQIWEGFRKRYPKIHAFECAGECEILTIKPQDIGLLPRETWTYGNNSFLLHGYYNYRYLILAKVDTTSGGTRYLLGVPGNYYSNEKYMASMFGFPHFVLAQKQPTGNGRFGYWYTDIRLDNLS